MDGFLETPKLKFLRISNQYLRDYTKDRFIFFLGYYVKKLLLQTHLRDLEFCRLNFQLEDKDLEPIMHMHNGYLTSMNNPIWTGLYLETTFKVLALKPFSPSFYRSIERSCISSVFAKAFYRVLNFNSDFSRTTTTNGWTYRFLLLFSYFYALKTTYIYVLAYLLSTYLVLLFKTIQ